MNIWNNEFIVFPYSSGNGKNTVKFVEDIKSRHPDQQIMLIWDGTSMSLDKGDILFIHPCQVTSSYHRGEEMKSIRAKYNDGKPKNEWLITCGMVDYL